ncbi:MAG: hypothetical protein ABMA14_01735 [Hyphomonadaceae bacterium]
MQVALDGRWQHDSAANLGDNPGYVIDAYGLLNASVGVRDLGGNWSASCGPAT